MVNEDQYKSTWKECLQLIEKSTSFDEFERWFSPLEPMGYDGGVLCLRVPSRSHLEYIEHNYIPLLRPIIRSRFGVKARLQYSVPEPTAVVPTSTSAKVEGVTVKNPFIIPGLKRVQFDSQLVAELCFDNFVEGACNRLARSAGKAIAVAPGTTSFNPLFVYGNSGLGKTHVAQAIGNAIKERTPESKVLYVSCNHFQNQFQRAVMRSELNDFLHFYQMIDVLIVDDIQEIAGKPGTQSIFFNIFNHLKLLGKQIILTSDRPPVELTGIEERLLTRFKWGLSAELTPPDYATRVEILKLKARKMGFNAPNNVFEFLAENIKANVRELEGALTALEAHGRLLGQQVTLELTRDIMRGIVSFTLPEVTVESIIELVSSVMDIPMADILSTKRTREIAAARGVAMYMCHERTKAPFSTIGTAIGGRTHSTVMHACKTVAGLMQTDKILRQQVEQIERKLQY